AQLAADRRRRHVAPLHPALHHAGRGGGGDHGALHTLVVRRHPRRGLHPHRTRQRPRRAARRHQARVAQCADSRGDHDGTAIRVPARRFHRGREGVQLARARPPARRCRRHARLSRDPGAGAAVLARVHPDQPGGGRALRPHQPDDPVSLMNDTAIDEAPVTAVPSGPSREAVRTPWSEFWRKFRRQKVALVAGAFVALLVVIAVLGPWIVPYDAENYFDYDQLNARPSPQHWFGVDALGRDIFSRIVMGARISLAAGFVSVAVGAIIGTFLGLLAGYFEGWWDRVIMRICDVLFAFPGILLAIAIVAILGGGMFNVIVAVAIFSIPTFARLVRGNTLALKHLTYIEAARSLGASDATIISRHIFPGTISAVIVYFS